MKPVTAQQITAAFSNLGKDLRTQRIAAEELKGDVDNTSPDDVSFPMPPGGGGMEDSASDEGGEKKEPAGPGEEKKKDASTPEKAKKLLEEAKTDLQAVIDNLEGLEGESKQEGDHAAVARISASYGEKIQSLTNRSEAALNDAKAAIAHWKPLVANRKKNRSSAPVVSTSAANTTSELASTEQTLHGIKRILATISDLFPTRTATAVPPTGAEFSGDLWGDKGNTALVENRAWESESAKFHADVKKENAMPNAAVEPRLDNQGYKHDDKPHVNASFNAVLSNKFASFWDVRDSRTGKRFVASFAGAPDQLGPRTDAGFGKFSSKVYGTVLCDAVITDGVDSVRASLNGKWLGKEASLDTVAKTPDIKNLGEVRKYYAEAFGSPEYARELTSRQHTTGKTASGTNDGMNIKYQPKDKTFRKTDEKTKDGPGKISAQESPDVTLARAVRAAAVARKIAAVGVIPFIKTAMVIKCRELMTLAKDNDAAFLAVEAQYDQMIAGGLMKNEAALTTAHIPDTETGIVGNSAEGVTKPASQVTTEDINSGVKGDAKINKKASLVPQIQTDNQPNGPDFSHMFTTTVTRLQRKGVDPGSLRSAVRRTIG